MSEAFRGEISQRVDAKARVSVPAAFRRVLEAGDPAYPGNPRPRMVLVYGGDNRSFCEGYTMAGMRRVEARIRRTKDKDARSYLTLNMIVRSQEIEIDDDGRIVLPPKGRDRMRLPAEALREGAEAMFAGTLDCFQIWYRPVFEGDPGSQAVLAQKLLPNGEDMSTLLPDDDDDDED